MKFVEKLDAARATVTAFEKAVEAEYGDNAQAYCAGFLGSMLVQAMADMDDDRFDIEVSKMERVKESWKDRLRA